MSSHKGLTIIYIGDGKGKTTASVGLAVRAAGSGMRVAFLQFVKGDWPSNEFKSFDQLENIDSQVMGEGFVGILGDKKPKSQHKKSARKALEYAREQVTSGKYDLVVLDEMISAVEEDILPLSDVEQIIKDKPENVHICLTGHNKYDSLTDLADLVTEMKMVKHPYYKGVLAQEGIDY